MIDGRSMWVFLFGSKKSWTRRSKSVYPPFVVFFTSSDTNKASCETRVFNLWLANERRTVSDQFKIIFCGMDDLHAKDSFIISRMFFRIGKLICESFLNEDCGRNVEDSAFRKTGNGILIIYIFRDFPFLFCVPQCNHRECLSTLFLMTVTHTNHIVVLISWILLHAIGW